MRWALLFLVLALGGCWKNCAGPGSTRVAREEGRGWVAEVRCEPKTRLQIDRSAAPILQGCYSETTGRVRGADLEATVKLPWGYYPSSDCGQVRGFCREMQAEILSVVRGAGHVVAFRVAGKRGTRLVHVTGDGVPFVAVRADLTETPAEALHAARSPEDEALAVLRAGQLRDPPNHEIAQGFRGALLRNNVQEVLAEALRCRVPRNVVATLAREQPELAFEPFFQAVYFGDGCDVVREGLHQGARSRLDERVVTALRQGAALQNLAALHALIDTVADERLVAAEPDVARIARDVPPAGAAMPVVIAWAAAHWAWSRIAAERAAVAAVEMMTPLPLEAEMTDLPKTPGHDHHASSPRTAILASTAMASNAPAVSNALVAVASNTALPRTTRQAAVLTLAAKRDPRATPFVQEPGLLTDAQRGVATRGPSTGEHSGSHHHHHW